MLSAGDRRVPLASTALSLLLHAGVLIACAAQVLVTSAEPPPIAVTLLGTHPDAGGSGAAPAPVVPAPAPAPPVAKPVPKPVAKVAPPPPIAPPRPKPPRDALRRPAAPRAPAAAAPAPAVAPARAPPDAGTASGDGTGGRGSGTGHGAGVGRGQRDGVQGDPSGSVLASYLERLRHRLEAVKRYPLLARRRGHAGTALLHIAIDRGGRPASVRIEASSGSSVLDAEATEMVSRAAPFEPLPAEIGDRVLRVTVPVRFDVSG